MADCASKDLPTVKDNYNEWYTTVWSDLPGENENWFEDSNSKLHDAFKGVTNASLPKIPGKPNRVQGKDEAEVAGELTAVSGKLVAYGKELIRYAGEVNKGHAKCASQTATIFDKLENEMKKVEKLPKPPTQNNNPVPLCIQFTKWSKSYHEWTCIFEAWEKAMDDCIKQSSPVPVTQQSPTSLKGTLAKMQVSPVPWPPWLDYVDEP